MLLHRQLSFMRARLSSWRRAPHTVESCLITVITSRIVVSQEHIFYRLSGRHLYRAFI